MKVAIVILAHNEAATIQSVVTAAAAFGSLIVVDDGSTDHTDQLAGEAGAQIVRHDHHRGYDAALQSGFEKADALGMDIVVTLDADGQHDPNIIANLVAPLESGKADLVIGVRASPPRFMERVFGAYTQRRYGVPDILCGATGMWSAKRLGTISDTPRTIESGSFGVCRAWQKSWQTRMCR